MKPSIIRIIRFCFQSEEMLMKSLNRFIQFTELYEYENAAIDVIVPYWKRVTQGDQLRIRNVYFVSDVDLIVHCLIFVSLARL